MQVEGGCHCGAVRFRAECDEEIELLECNCSICAASGYLHMFVPHERFALLRGEDALISYRFGSGAANHLFCGICGVKSFYQPRSHPEAWSVNFRALDPGLAIATRTQAFDGRNWEQAHRQLESD